MKESSRIDSPSIANCIDLKYQYTLVQPYAIPYKVIESPNDIPVEYKVAFPNEWNQYSYDANGGTYNGITSLRFTCHTLHQVGAPISVTSSISEYDSRPCFA
mgnify:FL=1